VTSGPKVKASIDALVLLSVSEKLHLRTFWEIAAHTPQLAPISRAPMIAVTGMVDSSRRGGVMRESFEIEMPDTAPYKEWLGMVGSMALAVLVGAILYSAGVWS
jgi:hypothetical protein